MNEAWSPAWQVIEERYLWLRILRFQTDQGVFDHVWDLKDKIRAYEQVVTTVDLRNIEIRERVTRHDVKARIEEFNHLASMHYYGWGSPHESLELIHTGMTSADVVDNISLIRIHKLLGWLEGLAQGRLTDSTVTADRLTALQARLPFRGIKGPVGTQQDQADLMGGEAAQELDRFLAECYGFQEVLNSVGQVYPRSIDLDVSSTLLSMPEMRQPWRTVAAGYTMMCASYSGDQWNEGDVSTSVVRRVALPGVLMCADIALRGVKP